ncbi:KTSC domain-containing protein [Actinophytocola sp.]|uniref:KTSC domain-containing protein n=1 Tax=Actinophytocola sp. TaxID=1872138 RepID=UPI002D7FB9D8|nr:KTSC domain-containing protein [Actinophytocola sp.]HET9143413.1 KTSC domain-containing protein [Actinophytocola sp.]HEU5111605.1 KTSC domain-containing protein [Micromonosporaceae bacterium]
MRRRPVDSSVVRAVGYDRDEQILEVEFHNDRIYRYFVVPHKVYQELLAAPSFGRYFNEKVRDRYPVRQVDR